MLINNNTIPFTEDDFNYLKNDNAIIFGLDNEDECYDFSDHYYIEIYAESENDHRDVD